MKQIAIIRGQDIAPGSPLVDPSNYPYRECARAVLFHSKRVALVYIANEHYYKLPGGGIEPNETAVAALRREVLEETGYQIENIKEIGETLEYKDFKPERQRALCFTAAIVGKPIVVQLTDEEKAIGPTLVWADNLEQAIKLTEVARPESISARFIQYRELLFLRAVLD